MPDEKKESAAATGARLVKQERIAPSSFGIPGQREVRLIEVDAGKPAPVPDGLILYSEDYTGEDRPYSWRPFVAAPEGE